MNRQKKTDNVFLAASNQTCRKFTSKVEPLPESLVLHAMKSVIPNLLNNVLDFFFAEHIVLYFCKYKDIESSRRYSNVSTQLFEGDTFVNIGRIDFGSLLTHSHKDVTSNVLVSSQ